MKNLINREEKEIFSLKILKIQEEKEYLVSESHKSGNKREFFLKILKIEKRKRSVRKTHKSRREREFFSQHRENQDKKEN